MVGNRRPQRGGKVHAHQDPLGRACAAIPERSASRGTVADINNPRDARALGIETIYQTLALADNLDASANIFLGREILTKARTLNEEAMASEIQDVLEAPADQDPVDPRACHQSLRWPAPGGGDRARDLLQRERF